MRAYININQKAFAELAERTKTKIDLVDAAIFEYIVKFAISSKAIKQLIDNKLFIWVSYQKIIDDNPLLGIGHKRAIENRINKLISLNLIEKYTDKKQGNKTYLNVTDLAYNLVINNEPLSHQNDEPLSHQNDEPLSHFNDYNSKLNNSNNIINAESSNSATKSSSNNSNKKNSYSKNFELLWNRYDKKTSNKNRSQKIYLKRWKNTDVKILLEAIDKYKATTDLTFQKDFDGFLNGLIDSYVPKRVWVVDRNGNKILGYFYDSENKFVSDEQKKLNMNSCDIEKYITENRFGYVA